MKHYTTIALLSLSIAVASPLVMAQQRANEHAQSHSPMHEYHPDAWVLAKVKAQFSASSIVDATDIDIDVDGGVVKLTGTVSSPAEKREAMRIARQTQGVHHVDVSDLRLVVTASDAKRMPQHEIEEDEH